MRFGNVFVPVVHQGRRLVESGLDVREPTVPVLVRQRRHVRRLNVTKWLDKGRRGCLKRLRLVVAVDQCQKLFVVLRFGMEGRYCEIGHVGVDLVAHVDRSSQQNAGIVAGTKTLGLELQIARYIDGVGALDLGLLCRELVAVPALVRADQFRALSQHCCKLRHSALFLVGPLRGLLVVALSLLVTVDATTTSWLIRARCFIRKWHRKWHRDRMARVTDLRWNQRGSIRADVVRILVPVA